MSLNDAFPRGIKANLRRGDLRLVAKAKPRMCYKHEWETHWMTIRVLLRMKRRKLFLNWLSDRESFNKLYCANTD